MYASCQNGLSAPQADHLMSEWAADTSGYSHVFAADANYGFELLHKPYSAEQLGLILGRIVQEKARRSSANHKQEGVQPRADASACISKPRLVQPRRVFSRLDTGATGEES